jgi:DNA-binding GntR family transcriptional regulator
VSVNVAPAAQAYVAVKRRILDQTYPPGEKLSEARLVEDLGLGRSPIRSALAQLKDDGWISVSPQSGTYVKSLGEKEIAELLELRLLLEGHVMRSAVKNLGVDELQALRCAYDAFFPRHAGSRNNPRFDQLIQFDALFHQAIYRAAGNSLITGMLLNLVDKIQWVKTSQPASVERVRSGFRELGRVLEALEARDAKKAAALMREHIGNAANYSAGVRRAAQTRRET